ncbi:MAG TPA: hypothetical protein VIY48_19515 [Candidatus Paceibacterota bacterium]
MSDIVERWYVRQESASIIEIYPLHEGLQSRIARVFELDQAERIVDRVNKQVEENERLRAENATLRQALRNHAEEAAKMVSAEPVAWMLWQPFGGKPQFITDQQMAAAYEMRVDLSVTPLYTHPRIPEGWVMVPKDPTQDMYEAGNSSGFTGYNGAYYVDPGAAYLAMVAAAPKRSQQAAPTSSTKENDV